MDVPLALPNDAPVQFYIRDIDLQVVTARPAVVLDKLPRNGGFTVVYLDNDDTAGIMPRGLYGVRKGVDLVGTPEMTQKISDDFLTLGTEVLVVTYGVGQPERLVRREDYEASLPEGSD